MAADVPRPMTDEDELARAGIDGRVVFAASAFALGAAILVLLDRVGVSERLVGLLGPALALLGLSIIGVLLRSMRVSRFYSGGRAVPAFYAGLAFAALAGGLTLPFVPPAPGSPSIGGLFGAFAGGLSAAALVTGPLLRRTGAFSVADLLAARFPNVALRLGTIAVVAVSSALVALAGFEVALPAFEAITGAGRTTAVVVLAVVIALVTVPGGVAGVVWAAAGSMGIALAVVAIPLGVTVLRGEALPMPVLGDRALWEAALARLGEWHAKLSPGVGDTTDWRIVAAATLGVATLAPLLAPAMTCLDRRRSRLAGGVGLVASLALAVMVTSCLGLAGLALDRALVGSDPGRLPPVVTRAAADGQVLVCGVPATSRVAVARACGPAATGGPRTLKAGEVVAGGQALLAMLPDLRDQGAAVGGLVAAAFVVAGLVLASAAVQAFATAIGHDAFYRVRSTDAMTSRRLAVTRLVAFAGICACAWTLRFVSIDPRAALALAVAFSAAAITPLLLLALWPRASGTDATVALLAGLAAAEATIVLVSGAATIDRLADSAVAGCGAALACGLLSSLFSREPSQDSRAVAHSMLTGRGEVLHEDKGA